MTDTPNTSPNEPLTADEWWLLVAVVRAHATEAYHKADTVPSAVLRNEWEKEAQRLDAIAVKLNRLKEGA